MHRFTIGHQPCNDFKPDRDGNEYGSWENLHSCMQPKCEKTVSFCMNCLKDHHEDGYEACTCECHAYLRMSREDD
jgi:hypothetical protein